MISELAQQLGLTDPVSGDGMS